MPGNNYTNKQKGVLNKIKGIVGQLTEIENLKKSKYQSQIGLDAYTDASVADIALDNCADYSTLEKRLKEAINNAIGLGLGKDPLVKKVSEVAFA